MKGSQVLLCIDIQNDYFPGGSMELAGAEEAGRKTQILLRHFRERDLPVIHIAHESVREGATFFVPGTHGQKIHPFVEPLADERVIKKNFPNSFLHTSLLETLQQLQTDRLVICGMMTHMCIDSTVRAAKDLGFSVTLVHDATATRDLSFAGKVVASSQVQTAFVAALANICDSVCKTSELLQL